MKVLTHLISHNNLKFEPTYFQTWSKLFSYLNPSLLVHLKAFQEDSYVYYVSLKCMLFCKIPSILGQREQFLNLCKAIELKNKTELAYQKKNQRMEASILKFQKGGGAK